MELSYGFKLRKGVYMLKKIMTLSATLLLAAPALGQNTSRTDFDEPSDKTLNIRLNPVGLLYGVSSLGVDFTLSERFTLGPQVAFYELEDGNNDADVLSYGARGQFFFDQVYTDSWYLAGTLDFVNAETENSTTFEEDDVTGFSTSLLLGYMWMWDTVNMQLGAGLQNTELDDATAATIDTASISGLEPVAEFNFGLAF